MLSEKPDGRAAVKDELVRRVRSHYDRIEQIAEDVEHLGYSGAAKILKERMPQEPRIQSGEMGEIIATEFFETISGFRIPVRRLRYKDGRDMALRGDDFLGVRENSKKRLMILKGESKSGQAIFKSTIMIAREQLSGNYGRPTTISLLFVSDRLLESTDADDRALGRELRNSIGLESLRPRSVAHGMFILAGSIRDDVLEADLKATSNLHEQISVGIKIEDHKEFITELFKEAGDLGNG